MCVVPLSCMYFALGKLGIISRKSVKRSNKTISGMECNTVDAIQQIRLGQQIVALQAAVKFGHNLLHSFGNQRYMIK